MPCVPWFACESIDCAACERMLFFVNCVISYAMSASRIVDSAACTFCSVVATFAAAKSKRDSAAPMLPSAVLIVLIAVSRRPRAVCAFAPVVSDVPERFRPAAAVVRLTDETVTWSFAPYEPDEPTWKAAVLAPAVTTMSPSALPAV